MLPETVRIGRRQVLAAAAGLQALVFLTVFCEVATGVDLWMARPLFAVVYLTIVPGLLIVTLLGLDYELATVTGYVVGTSLITTMIVGGVISLLFPGLGVTEPLRPVPLSLSLGSVVAALWVSVYRAESEFSIDVPIGALVNPLPLGLLLIPFGSVLGTAYQTGGGSNIPLMTTLIVVAVTPLVLLTWTSSRRWYGLAVWMLAIALVYNDGLWPFSGGHQLISITIEQGRWIPNYQGGGIELGSLLPNGVLYPAYALLGDIPMGVQWDLVNPFIVALLPVWLFAMFRWRTNAQKALIGACLFMFSFPFYTLYPGGGRVATPVFFLALTGLAASDDLMAEEYRQPLSLVFAAGISVSHYGTSWVVMVAFIISAMLLLATRVADRLWPGRNQSRPDAEKTMSDGGVRSSLSGQSRVDRGRLLQWPFIVFYSAFTLAWYLYTGLGGKFKTLPNHIANGIAKITSGSTASGDAARSLTKDYGSISIAWSRQLYLLFGVLMALGILILAWKRVIRNKKVVSDEFLALGGGFFTILAIAFLPFSSGFNTARVMMIVFAFSALFMTFGAGAILNGLSQGVSAFKDRLPVSADWAEVASVNLQSVISAGRVAVSGLGILLAVFLLLNTGVVAELVTKDYAPTNPVSTERLLNSEDPIERSQAGACTDCKVQMHVWILENKAPSRPIYGDFLLNAQIDYWRGPITRQLDKVPTKVYNDIWEIRNGTKNTSYIAIRPYNMDTGGVLVKGKYDWRQLDMNGLTKTTNRIYVSGDSRIYMSK
ncbi:DUF2206 domain-containing protein [Halorientalis pallida]|uniref:DUF2206 domain-containing protein n=1 Tax=Halorientalis pallida TaxID=2479928 RepID=A0A498KWH4_9EURY|nr:DUF2206 domain-containing protein [Halorientalis pallida]RXK46947.1 DUF2206 domain-containing protein [Halorientalis pallida]